MSAPWTAEMDQRLLLAYVATNKSSAGDVAEKWKELYSGQNIPQRTTRAIKEHILKLKKSIGLLSGGRTTGRGGSKRAPKRGGPVSSPLNGSTTTRGSDPSLKIDRDDTERAVSVKTEAAEATSDRDIAPGAIQSDRGVGFGSPSNAKGGKGKGKKIDSSSSELSMSESESEDEVVLLQPRIKHEDDDFRMPQIDDNGIAIPSPKRIQQSRQAKDKAVKFVDVDETDSSDYSFLGDSKSVTAGRSPSPPPAVSSEFDSPPHVSSEVKPLRPPGRKRKDSLLKELGFGSTAKKARKSLPEFKTK